MKTHLATPFLAAVVLAVDLSGCASAPPPPAPTAAPAAPAAPAETVAPVPPAHSVEADDFPPSATKLPKVPPEELRPRTGAVLPLVSLLPAPGKGSLPSFSKATAGDHDCMQEVGLTGRFDKDYEALTKACGTSTGMKPYVQKVSGKFEKGHWQDIYQLEMVGGLCYRMFAVGDRSVEGMTIRVERPNGSLLSSLKSKDPVVILDPSEPWCKRHDRDFHIVVETAGSRPGQYAFGIWVRKNPLPRIAP